MNDFVDSFIELERTVAAERGDFALFALLAREDLPDRWDLVVAAPWIDDRRGFVEYLVNAIKESMGAERLVELSRIVVMNPDDKLVRVVNSAFSVEHGAWEVRDTDVFGLDIRHAFIITSQSLASAA
jgi:hypothetical protein